MDYETLIRQAHNDIETANGYEVDEAASAFFLQRSIATSLTAIADRLGSIDDALRNTVGGSPR